MKKIILMMTLTMCSMIVSYGQTFTSKMDSVNTKTDTAFTHNPAYQNPFKK